MKQRLRLVVALGILVAVGPVSWPASSAAAVGIETVQFRGGGGGGFHGGGFHGGGFRGGGFRGGGFPGGRFRGGYGGRRFYRPHYGYGRGFPGYGGYGFQRRRAWCFYHPGACYRFP